MISKIVLILALCSQVFTAFGRTSLVLCVHQSGRTAIEFVGSLCCEKTCPCDDECPAEESAVICPADDPCSDSPLPVSEARLEAGKYPSIPGELQRVDEPPSFVLTPVHNLFSLSERVPVFESPPASMAIVALLRTVVLLV